MSRVLTAAEYRSRAALDMSERALQDAVVELAKRLGWLAYHTHDSRHSTAGFPDLVLVHLARPRLLIVELKSQRGALRVAQKVWLRALANAGVRTAIWRPGDLLAGTIRDELARPPPALADNDLNHR